MGLLNKRRHYLRKATSNFSVTMLLAQLWDYEGTDDASEG